VAGLRIKVPAESFEQLVTEGWSHPTEGWDFSWLGSRIQEDPLPWDYTAIVAEMTKASPDLLDLGTGGGEWLARLSCRPPRTVATEGWPPNFSVACKRLMPLGVEVVEFGSPWDNLDLGNNRVIMPFADSSFHLIIDRHESFVPAELARVLVAGGHFVTQQVGGWERLTPLLRLPPVPHDQSRWRLSMAISQLEAAGFQVLRSGEARPTTHFADVGALIWYLKMIPWAVPDFSPDHYRARLLELHDHASEGHRIEFQQERFWLLAQAPV
jgi:hypothetical protein